MYLTRSYYVKRIIWYKLQRITRGDIGRQFVIQILPVHTKRLYIIQTEDEFFERHKRVCAMWKI